MLSPSNKSDISQEEIELVNEVLKTSFLSLGPKIIEFERKFAAFAGREYAVAVNSGTSGLHLIIRRLGISEGVR